MTGSTGGGAAVPGAVDAGSTGLDPEGAETRRRQELAARLREQFHQRASESQATAAQQAERLADRRKRAEEAARRADEAQREAVEAVRKQAAARAAQAAAGAFK